MSTLLYLVQELAGIAGGVNVVGVCRVIIYLFSHIYRHHLSNDLQSAYKRFLSIETALLKIHNYIVDNTDSSKVTALTLLDISAAFDKIDHLILLQRLHRHAQLFSGSNHIFQTDTKALTYLAHYLAHKTFHSECRKDPSLALFCLANILRLSAKSLLIIILVFTCMLMAHRFTYHFNNQLHKNLFRL